MAPMLVDGVSVEFVPIERVPRGELRALWRACRPPEAAAADAPRKEEPADKADEPFKELLGFGARAGERLVAVASAMPFEQTGDQGRCTYPYVTVLPEWRRKGIGGRMLGALIDLLRSSKSVDVALVDMSGPEVPREWCERFGFRASRHSLEYRCETGAAAAGPEDAAPFRIVEYLGGDPALAEAMIAAHERAYASRFGVPRMTVEDLEQHFKYPGAFYIVLLEGERVVGHVHLIPHEGNLWVGSILVRRSHWGTAASGILFRASLRAAHARGIPFLAGAIEESNRASRAMAERFGSTVHRRIARLVLELG